MRLCVGRDCGLWSIPMVKLVSGADSLGTGVGTVSAAVADGGVAGVGRKYGLPDQGGLD